MICVLLFQTFFRLRPKLAPTLKQTELGPQTRPAHLKHTDAHYLLDRKRCLTVHLPSSGHLHPCLTSAVQWSTNWGLEVLTQ